MHRRSKVSRSCGMRALIEGGKDTRPRWVLQQDSNRFATGTHIRQLKHWASCSKHAFLCGLCSEDRLVAACASVVPCTASSLQAPTIDHPDAIVQHTLFKKRPFMMVRQQRFNHRLVAATLATKSGCCWRDLARLGTEYSRRVRVSCRRRSVADEGMDCEILMLRQSSDGTVLLALPNTVSISCVSTRAPHIDRRFGGTTLLAEIWFEQESCTEVLRHLCCEPVQARRVPSFHHFATMEAQVNPIRQR